MSAPEEKKWNLLDRGTKRPNQAGTLTFVGLRALDPFLQYGILAKGIGSGLLSTLRLEQLPAGLATNTGSFIDSLGLSPYRLILLTMATGSAVKQNWWATSIAQYELSPAAGVTVSALNTVVNGINNLLFTTTLASASLSSGEQFPQWPLIAGVVAYVVGMALEVVSEQQRKNFKADPKNKGQACTTGLWSVARHINYSGYSLWRAGFATAAAGFGWGAATMALFLWDFNNRAIPELDDYCSKRYNVQWAEYKKKTPYKLVPYVL